MKINTNKFRVGDKVRWKYEGVGIITAIDFDDTPTSYLVQDVDANDGFKAWCYDKELELIKESV
jgi:hypothetical protein